VIIEDVTEAPAPDGAWTEHLAAAHQLLEAAGQAGLTLRLVGSVGCRLHCAEHEWAFGALEREDPPDLDLVAPGKDRNGVRRIFGELGYDEDRDMTVAMEGRRYKYWRSRDRLNADLFVDRLEFCHPIDVTKRFGLDSPTLSLADLVLSKLQIVEMNLKDLKDLTVLFLAHDVGSGDREAVDPGYIARLGSEDWGLYYTMSRNVERVRAFLEGVPFADEQRVTARRRIDALWDAVQASPKSLKWKLRAKVGPRVQWYQDVSEPEPTF